MACSNPRMMYYHKDPNVISGKHPLTSSRKKAHPFKPPVPISCGKCESCRRQHVARIATACAQHMRTESASCYLTLTYDEEHLPENGTLVKKHVDGFIKGLRAWIKRHKKEYNDKEQCFSREDGRFKYVLSGEYGSKGNRPHYHVFIMGFDFPDKTPLPLKSGGHQLFRSKVLEQYWPYGLIDYKNADEQVVGYVVKYAMKEKLHGREYEQQYTDKGLSLPFVSVSQGVGVEYAKKYQDELFRHGTFLDHQSNEVPLNRRQLQQLARIDPEKTEQYKEQRRKEKLAEVIPKEYYYPDPSNMGAKWELNLSAASQFAIRKELTAMSKRESRTGVRSEEYKQLQSMLDPVEEHRELQANAELREIYEEKLNRLSNPRAVSSKKQNDKRRLDIQREQDNAMLEKWRKNLRSKSPETEEMAKK